MARQKTYSKSDLSFDDLLRAGLGVPLKDQEQPAQVSERATEYEPAPSRQPKKPAGKARRKRG